MSYSIPNNGGDISRATAFVLGLKSGGGTNINDALLEALEIAERVKTQEEISSKTEQLIIFLSDGQPQCYPSWYQKDICEKLSDSLNNTKNNIAATGIRTHDLFGVHFVIKFVINFL